MKAIFKLNNGNLAILCSKCSVIIKTGKDFTKEESLASKGKLLLNSQFCEKCKNMNNKIILIETQPSTTINYFPGSITLEGKELYFEIMEKNDFIQVLWAENYEIPQNTTQPENTTKEGLEEEIIEQFKKGR